VCFAVSIVMLDILDASGNSEVLLLVLMVLVESFALRLVVKDANMEAE